MRYWMPKRVKLLYKILLAMNIDVLEPVMANERLPSSYSTLGFEKKRVCMYICVCMCIYISRKFRRDEKNKKED